MNQFHSPFEFIKWKYKKKKWTLKTLRENINKRWTAISEFREKVKILHGKSYYK
jgi:hypothetical protein